MLGISALPAIVWQDQVFELGTGETMRKYFWCGAILMVAAAVAVYAAAIYTGRHPDFLLGALKQVAALAGKRAGARHPAAPMPGDVDSTGEESEINELQPEEMCLPDQLDPVEGMRCLPGPLAESDEAISVFGPQKDKGSPEATAGAQHGVPRPTHQVIHGGLGTLLNASKADPMEPVLPEDPMDVLRIMPQAVLRPGDLQDDCPSVMPHCREEESSPPPVTAHAHESNSANCPRCTQEKRPGKQCSPAQEACPSEGEEQEKGSRKESMLPPELLQKRLDSLLKPYRPCETCPSARKVDTLDFRPSDARKGEFDPIPF
jgi:hypothetical protein